MRRLLTAPSSVRGQDGSMLLAMMAALVVGGLVVVLVSRTQTTQSQVRFDRDFQYSVNAAEAGLQQAITAIQQLGIDETETFEVVLSSDDYDGAPVGDGTFEWEAKRRPDGSWRIESWGERNGVTRKLEAEGAQDPRFFMAAFGRLGLRMVGNTDAESYVGNATDTGFGAVGSNGMVSMIGNSTADVVQLFGEGASCGDNFYDEEAQTCNDVPIEGADEPIDFDAIVADVEAEMAEACGGSFEPFSASAHSTLQGGETYCFSDIVTGNNTTIEVADGSISEPARVYVHPGPIELGNGNVVNCPPGKCDYDAGQVPDSGALQLLTTADEVRIGNHGDIAAGILAPRALCRGNPSSSHTNIFGSLICERVGNEGSGNQGGWSFYFDQRLLEIGNGRTQLQGVREEVGGSTSFED